MPEHTAVVTGPYFEFSFPYGKAIPSLDRDVWWVSLDSRTLGSIQRFHRQRRRFIIVQSWPSQEFRSLRAAVSHLVEMERNPERRNYNILS